MQIYSVAVFIDLENIPKFRVDDLMRDLMLLDDDSTSSQDGKSNIIFAVKRAYGMMSPKATEMNKQLVDHGFYLIHTPHVAQKKNRVDLFISLDAFESLYLNNPPILRYVFLTSDSDFTVIGEKLRKYGKQVWLVCRKEDKQRAIMSNAFDKLIFIDEYQVRGDTATSDQQHPQRSQSDTIANDEAVISLFLEVLKNVDLDQLPINVSVINDRMKRLDPGFEIKHTSFKRFSNLVEYFEKKNMIETSRGEDRTIRLVNVNLESTE